MNKERTNLYLQKDLKEKLERLAKRSRRSLSQYVEDLIDQCPETMTLQEDKGKRKYGSGSR